MRVTRFQYPLETNMIIILNAIAKRINKTNPKKDAVFLVEGAEGEGKTTLSIAQAYYLAEQTGYEFDARHIFFEAVKMQEFLQNSDKQIAIWDEPALNAMSGDHAKKIVRDLWRLLQMMRKKRHIIIINMTYFNKFSDYIVWQRPLCMFHVYSRDEAHPGRFIYIKRKNLEYLYEDWRSKHHRSYFKYKSRIIRGTFPDILNPYYKYNVLSEFDLKYYEEEKDKAIQLIGKEPNIKTIWHEKWRDLFKKIVSIREYPVLNQQDMLKKMKLSPDTFNNLKKLLFPKEIKSFTPTEEELINNIGIDKNLL